MTLESQKNDLYHELQGYLKMLYDFMYENYGPNSDHDDDEVFFDCDCLVRDIEGIDGLGLSDEEWIMEAESLIQQAEKII